MITKKSSLFLSKFSQLLLGSKNNYRLRYYHQRKRFPNLKHPKDLSERLIAAMFSPEFLKFADYADKFKVRDYVKAKGLEDTLLSHYGVWDRPENIDFDSLPDKFILKVNNGCGSHVICKDKSQFNRDNTIKKLNANLQNGLHNIEPHYRVIQPKVFCEELIDTGTDDFPTDYKFTCIKGKICDVFVATDRRVNAKYVTLDIDWNILPYTKSEYLPDKLPEKPKLLDEMIKIAKILSADFEFVRVDLYEYRDKVYFSELTFSPWGALMYSYTDGAIKLLGKKFEE